MEPETRRLLEAEHLQHPRLLGCYRVGAHGCGLAKPAGAVLHSSPERALRSTRSGSTSANDVAAAVSSTVSEASAPSRFSGRISGRLIAAVTSNIAEEIPEPLQQRRGLLLVCCSCMLMLVGVGAGMVVEDWDFVTSLYVFTQIVTTVGYGDVTVKSSAMRLFMGVYVLFALLVCANVLHLVSNHIIERHTIVLRERLARLEFGNGWAAEPKRAHAITCKVKRAAVATLLFVSSIASGMAFFLLFEKCACPPGVVGCDGSTYSRCVATGGMLLSWSNAFYMSVVTVTTVGFGDFTPRTVPGRLFAIFWMLGGVTTTGFFISAISGLIAGGEQKGLEGACEIHEALFRDMDADGNGFLTKTEYTRFVLLKHNIVDRHILDDIDRKFEQMDMDGSGQVTWKMVQAAASRASATARSSSSVDGAPDLDV